MDLIKSHNRVVSHAEVFTPTWLVGEMLGLITAEVEDPSSRFLEPSCGSGNFLVEVAKRRFVSAAKNYGPGRTAPLVALVSMMNLFGIELLSDNVAECRRRLRELFRELFDVRPADPLDHAAAKILSQNIRQGDADLLLDSAGEDIEIPMWSIDPSGQAVAQIYRLQSLTDKTYSDESLFSKSQHLHSITPVRTEVSEDFASLFEDDLELLVRLGSARQDLPRIFDVVLGNPPYHQDDNGFGRSSISIYPRFVEQAINFGPRFVLMVIPARWYVGGKGLGSFRRRMINDRRIRNLVDFPDSSAVFPGTQIKGGVCFFLWDQLHDGPCDISTRFSATTPMFSTRFLNSPQHDVFVRFEIGVSVIKSVLELEAGQTEGATLMDLPLEKRFQNWVSSRKPFGLDSSFVGYPDPSQGEIKVFRRSGVGYLNRSQISDPLRILEKWKVFVPRASSGFDGFPHHIIGQPLLGPPLTACSETYLAIGPMRSELEARAVMEYMQTKFFRFLCLLSKATQDTPKGTYRFVPRQHWGEEISDTLLYKRYGLSNEEVDLIERLVSPTKV